MKIINPATEEIISEIKEDSKEELLIKSDELKTGQLFWKETSLDDRIHIIRTFSDSMEEEKEVLAAALSAEVGKPVKQSRNEINGGRSRIKWLADNAGKYLSPEIMTVSEGLTEKISYEPLGVICNISAWNYPFLVGINVFVPALLAGNAVMYKPSEYATITGLHIRRLLIQSGIPENVFHVAVGGKETGELLLDMDFDGYFFTGSYKTGKYIYERVAPRMIPCQLELGGKDPLYVTDDIDDISSVASATADGAFYNNGQSCCAVERIYVHENVYEKYINAFLNEVRSYKSGSPMDEDVYIGPLTRKDQLKIIKAQISDAVESGAKVLNGGKKTATKGYYFEPTVLVNVTNNMKVMKEESFGPVIGIMKVKNDEEALELMKDNEYGLTASVYSADQRRAEAILEKLDVGTGYWNCCDRVSAAVPWSGRKHSGFGSTLSHIGLRAFTKPKAWQMRES